MQTRQALQDFADLGGRVFASCTGTPTGSSWATPAFASIRTFSHNMGARAVQNDTTIDRARSRPGSALAQWMMNVMGSTTLGTVTIAQDASARLIDQAAGPPISQRWIYASTLNPQSVQFLSATTPIPTSPSGPGGTCEPRWPSLICT